MAAEANNPQIKNNPTLPSFNTDNPLLWLNLIEMAFNVRYIIVMDQIFSIFKFLRKYLKFKDKLFLCSNRSFLGNNYIKIIRTLAVH